MILTRVFLVRHCQASGNLDGVFQGSIDTDITQTGQQQLEQLRERFRLQKLDAVYTSPLLRARLTADAVNFYHGLPVRIEQDLREIEISRRYLELESVSVALRSARRGVNAAGL